MKVKSMCEIVICIITFEVLMAFTRVGLSMIWREFDFEHRGPGHLVSPRRWAEYSGLSPVEEKEVKRSES